jgi:hypothetical protein
VFLDGNILLHIEKFTAQEIYQITGYNTTKHIKTISEPRSFCSYIPGSQKMLSDDFFR